MICICISNQYLVRSNGQTMVAATRERARVIEGAMNRMVAPHSGRLKDKAMATVKMNGKCAQRNGLITLRR